MEPTSLSASGLSTYQECPARFKAEYIDRIRISSGGGSAGDLGSCVHEALEWWVKEGRFFDQGSKPLGEKVRAIAPDYGLDQMQTKDAVKMVFAWYDRWINPDNPPFEVLQVEVKENFLLKAKDANGVPHQIGVVYIWDRVDKMQDGSIRVVDYKSWMKYMDGSEIFNYLQVRIYALAAAIKYKDMEPPYIWVQLDQLRYKEGAIAVRFTRDDIRDIWAWLRGLYIKILADDGTREIVGNGCRWCVRSTHCASFNRAVFAGTLMSYTTAEEAARKVAEINAVMGALKDNKDTLVDFLESYLQEQGELEQSWPDPNGQPGMDVHVKVSPRSKRTVRQQDAQAALGPLLAGKYGKLELGVIDELLDGDELDDEQKELLRKSIDPGMTTSTNAVFK